MIAFLDLIDNYEDKERFKHLYHKYRGLMAYIAGEKVSTQEDIEDVLQEAFFYIAKHFEKIGDIESNRTKCYIAAITEGYAIKKYKAENKHDIHPNEDLNIDEISEDIDFSSYDKAELSMVIDELSDEYKNLLYLTYVFGYSSKEISEMLGLSDANIRKRIQFAKTKVRDKLESWK